MVSMKSLFLIWLVILAATYPALSMLKDRIVNWSEYDSFFIAIKESKWKATWILLYNTYEVLFIFVNFLKSSRSNRRGYQLR